MMEDVKSTVIQAAIEVFIQYGVKKTSMADIATRAGVSRQTLYVNFEGKDEMLAAAMQAVTDTMLEKLTTKWGRCDSIEDKLSAYFEIVTISTYELLKERPDAKDILLGVGEVSANVAKKVDQRKINMLTQELLVYEEQLARSKTDAKSVAHFVVSTTCNLKYSVKSRRELNALLNTLKLSVLALMHNR